ncbi:MAG: magnesium transporter CorA family protein [Myxococcales bacterium]|nr:magnesium transporter CorA family protein [Myxococcales bacterium]MCB9630196.1 magnesium transporter CorA family protein [Sandaracinaceae bacterium]
MTVRTLLLDPNTNAVQVGDEALLTSWLADRRGTLWMDIGGEEPEQEQALLERFDVDELSIQDALRERHPPKVEEFGSYILIILRGVDGEADGLDFKTLQLSMFVGDDFLVTRHAKRSSSVDHFMELGAQTPDWLTWGSAYIATQIAVRMANRYLPLLLNLEPRLEALEEEMFERPSDAVMAELTSYKTDLRRLRRVFMYHEKMFGDFRHSRSSLFGDDLRHDLNDVFENYERLHSLSTMLYETAGDLIDGYISSASHRLNHTMRVLTVITAIFVPLSFLAGLYGMNFEHIPELKMHNGYYVLLAFMATLATSLLALFKWQKWL